MTFQHPREWIARRWFFARFRRRFRELGNGSFIVSPFRIDGAPEIAIGVGTFVQRGVWLYCAGLDGELSTLTIGARCVFGYNNHITAARDVSIGDDVLTANNVFISDSDHGFEDTTTPIMQQPLRVKAPVSIGSGSWIGENACVLGASIGRNCVIGANAVVVTDIPDFSVAVGNPARVVRQFDPLSQQWRKIERACRS
jgi:acetyltransferase-like isoleucine patch superfamily enzyme